jgi:hypothetical protein
MRVVANASSSRDWRRVWASSNSPSSQTVPSLLGHSIRFTSGEDSGSLVTAPAQRRRTAPSNSSCVGREGARPVGEFGDSDSLKEVES